MDALVAWLRVLAAILMLWGVALIGTAQAYGTQALVGFGMFCLGIAALDGLFRRQIGFRQISVLLGWMAAGMAAWSMAVRTLLEVLELPIPAVLDSLLIAAASCAAGSVASALTAVTLRRMSRREDGRVRALLRRVRAAVSPPPGGPPRGPELAEPRLRPTGPVQGG